jgi:hypothetical protein
VCPGEGAPSSVLEFMAMGPWVSQLGVAPAILIKSRQRTISL